MATCGLVNKPGSDLIDLRIHGSRKRSNHLSDLKSTTSPFLSSPWGQSMAEVFPVPPSIATPEKSPLVIRQVFPASVSIASAENSALIGRNGENSPLAQSRQPAPTSDRPSAANTLQKLLLILERLYLRSRGRIPPCPGVWGAGLPQLFLPAGLFTARAGGPGSGPSGSLRAGVTGRKNRSEPD